MGVVAFEVAEPEGRKTPLGHYRNRILATDSIAGVGERRLSMSKRLGTDLRSRKLNPRVLGTNPRALGTNPKMLRLPWHWFDG